MRSGQAWAIVVAILSVPMHGGWAATGAILAVLLLIVDDRDRRAEP